MNEPINKWYLQRQETHDYPHSRTVHIYEFWDTYLHHDCELIKETTENPFKDVRNE
jgi:hypothetical protein